jgi:hypothetical protein
MNRRSFSLKPFSPASPGLPKNRGRTKVRPESFSMVMRAIRY